MDYESERRYYARDRKYSKPKRRLRPRHTRRRYFFDNGPRTTAPTKIARALRNVTGHMPYNKGCLDAILHTFEKKPGNGVRYLYKFSRSARVAVSDFVAAQVRNVCTTSVQLLKAAKRLKVDAVVARAATNMVVRGPVLANDLVERGEDWVKLYRAQPVMPDTWKGPDDAAEQRLKFVKGGRRKLTGEEKAILKRQAQWRKAHRPFLVPAAPSDATRAGEKAPKAALPGILAGTRQLMSESIGGRFQTSTAAAAFLSGVAYELTVAICEAATDVVDARNEDKKHFEDKNFTIHTRDLQDAMASETDFAQLIGRGHMVGAGVSGWIGFTAPKKASKVGKTKRGTNLSNPQLPAAAATRASRAVSMRQTLESLTRANKSAAAAAALMKKYKKA